MTSKSIRISGWLLTVVLALLLGFSAFMKITLSPMALAQASSMGLEPGLYQMIGWAELVSLILFIIPKTGLLGTLLLIAYMGGAIATHLQQQQPVAVPIIVQGLIWITAVLRYPEVVHSLFPTIGKIMDRRW